MGHPPAQAWRDAYSLACLLEALHQLSGGQPRAALQPSSAPSALSTLTACLRTLDLALLMGGPRWRPQVRELFRAARRSQGSTESPSVAQLEAAG